MQPKVDPSNVEEVFAHWLKRFGESVEDGDPAAIAAFIEPDGHWKDILAFTWSYKTFTGRDEIEKALKATLDDVKPRSLRLSTDRAAPRLVRRSARSVIEAYFDFDTEIGAGTGFVRLVYDPASPGNPLAWILLTTLQQIHGFDERIGDQRPSGVDFSHSFASENWLDARIKEQRFDERDPEVLVVGAGQAGLSVAARLKAIGVDALLIERNERVGDNWRQRYHSLTLHNEIWANSLPYLPFPPTWPTFVPKDKLAGWLEFYADVMELNVWTGTELHDATYDERARTWSVAVRRADGSTRELTVPHLVLATGGVSGVPNMPAMKGLEKFRGEIIHSSDFRSGTDYAGRKAIVFGTGNSGHDVAQDLYSNGAESVSIVQRGSTCVVSLVPSGTLVYSLYSEGPSAEDIDLITAAIPYPVLKDTYQWLTKRTRVLDQELLDKLAAVGFETDYGEDNTGFHMKYLRTGGGYYINVGCSDLIADRKINLVQARDIATFDETGLVLADDQRIDADLAVMATGYRNLQEGVRGLLGDEIADRVGPIWGFDEDYTMRNMWKRTAQPGLWFMGGALMDCRLHSRFLALQIKAELEGIMPSRLPFDAAP
ncbi:flavin-containing monooxygenase [Saccharopolyspora spinosa]|uniref:Cation diffusion facilitator CzcD-associated flavoprotein CzcO n=1 Tax=Saccharopolyspora spinosa TaxID=60894 RepID=A0A2N3Y3J4_SACSN|nr:NAD(P)/FAD-dependent oxidoreductase [Saccharopolyspora spinosa]PKW17474.1 cation diffusion facilitator CzcD-associated flavoprotein CzcO [Saccharopolyspora spinosa]